MDESWGHLVHGGVNLQGEQRSPAGSRDEPVRVFHNNGEPLKDIPFFILDGAGKEYRGLTDEEGWCPPVYVSTAQKLTIYLGIQALEMWQNNGGQPTALSGAQLEEANDE